MKVVLLAGGLGLRICEEIFFKLKPMEKMTSKDDYLVLGRC